MDKQYDISLEMRKLFEKKQKQRAEAKEYFQKLIYNPFRPISDGVPPDLATIRFHALCTYSHNYHTLTPTSLFKILVLLSPIAITYYAISNYKKKKEERLRSGLIKYEDRYNKVFLY